MRQQFRSTPHWRLEGFEPRPAKELTCFSPLLTGGCEIDSLITSCFTGRRGYDFRQGQSEVQNLDEPCVHYW
jgi:hypothetical protein